MGKRRTARERALQVLFELEFNDAGPAEVLAAQWQTTPAADEVRAYAERLVESVVKRRAELDARIQATSRNWRIARMTAVDRNILRLAVFEMLEEKPALAPAIIINEAIEIARRFSGDESAVFVNGVLDAVRKNIDPQKEIRKDKDHEPRPDEPPPLGQAADSARGRKRAPADRPGAGSRRKI